MITPIMDCSMNIFILFQTSTVATLKFRDIYIYIYTHTHTHTYIYIYIYISPHTILLGMWLFIPCNYNYPYWDEIWSILIKKWILKNFRNGIGSNDTDALSHLGRLCNVDGFRIREMFTQCNFIWIFFFTQTTFVVGLAGIYERRWLVNVKFDKKSLTFRHGSTIDFLSNQNVFAANWCTFHKSYLTH